MIGLDRITFDSAVMAGLLSSGDQSPVSKLKQAEARCSIPKGALASFRFDTGH